MAPEANLYEGCVCVTGGEAGVGGGLRGAGREGREVEGFLLQC